MVLGLAGGLWEPAWSGNKAGEWGQQGQGQGEAKVLLGWVLEGDIKE